MAFLRSTFTISHLSSPLPPVAPFSSELKIRPLHGGATTSRGSSLRSVSPAEGLGLGSLRRRNQGFKGTVCYASPLTTQTVQWVATVSAAILMLTKGTAIQKSFLVPLVALQAPASVISWIKGEYGIWTAFLALLVRLFYFIPGELDLPFLTMLLVIVAPYQTLNLRGTQPGAIISLAIAGYLAFQHFSRAGSLRRAFDQGSIVATLAVICITVVPFLFLI